jgi:hypothetical protein
MKPKHALLFLVATLATVASLRLVNWLQQPDPATVKSLSTAPDDPEESPPANATPALAWARARHSTRPPAPPRSLRERLIDSNFETVPDEFKPSREALERYLTASGRAPGSLLAAFNLSGDTNLLREAAAQYPDDPQVQFAVLTRDVLPGQRRAWLDAFQESSPGNSLPDYLSAFDHLQAGRAEQAYADLANAAAKPGIDDFFLPTLQDMEEAHLAAGLSPVDAKMLASMELPLPHLQMLRDLGRELAGTAQRFQSAGDTAAAAQIAAYGLELGGNLQQRQPVPLITELVGIAIEKGMLSRLDPAVAQAALGGPVDKRLAELNASRDAIKAVAQADTPFSGKSQWNDADTLAYLDRMKLFGEKAALQWLQQRQANP